MTIEKGTSIDFDWEAFHKLYLAWDIWILIALLTPLAAFVMMILKIPR